MVDYVWRRNKLHKHICWRRVWNLWLRTIAISEESCWIVKIKGLRAAAVLLAFTIILENKILRTNFNAWFLYCWLYRVYLNLRLSCLDILSSYIWFITYLIKILMNISHTCIGKNAACKWWRSRPEMESRIICYSKRRKLGPSENLWHACANPMWLHSLIFNELYRTGDFVDELSWHCQVTVILYT